MTLFFWLTLLSFCLTLAVTVEIGLGMQRMHHIRDVPPSTAAELPRVSIIIPACNEAKTIELALQSVLSLDYPDLEILVINDRSTDGTATVLQALKQKYPHLKLFTISELPVGWMGKAHALQFGADQATGGYLLFTDADIVIQRSTLLRAMGYVLGNDLDHLSMLFKNTAEGGLLNTLLLELGGGLLHLFKPWLAKQRDSGRFMGVGAFNLVRSSAYLAIGGHRSFAMHPIDDIMLGKIIKRRGFSQDCLLGDDFIKVEWYGSIGALIDGLMKNAFALYDFRVPRVLAGCLLILLLGVLPSWGLLLGSGLAQSLCGAVVVVRFLSFAHGLTYTPVSSWNAIWALVTPYINIYIAVKAMVTTLRRRGIIWRGTHYSLAAMKSGGGLY